MSIGTPSFPKHPDEEVILGFFYRPEDLPTGETIVSSAVSATKLSDGSDVSATLLGSTTGTVTTTGDNQDVSVLVKDGTADEEYIVKFVNTLSDNEKMVDCLRVQVEGCPTD
jgi:hypothetical protein